MDLKYQTGFGNEFATEAIEGALPIGQNSPQKAPLGLYAEQLSGTAFTVPRSGNKRTWTYLLPRNGFLDYETVDRFTPDGAEVWVKCDGGRLCRLDAKTGRSRSELVNANGVIGPSSDGRFLATVGFNGVLEIISLAGDSEPVSISTGVENPAAVAFSGDGRTLAVSDPVGAIQLFDWRKQKRIGTVVIGNDLNWTVVAPDGRFDSSELTNNLSMSWVHPSEPLRPVPLEGYMKDFYTPQLLRFLLDPHSAPAVPSLSEIDRRMPTVEITEVRPAQLHGSVDLDVEVRFDRTVTDLRLFREGKLVATLDGVVPLEDGKARLSFKGIRLPSAANKDETDGKYRVSFQAYAFSQSGMKSVTANLTYAFDQLPKRQPHAYVVAIGVSESAIPTLRLTYTGNDARLLAPAITRAVRNANPGIEVEQTLLISETDSAGASKERIREALANVARRAGPDDIVVISYSGHGQNDAGGRFHLVPSDVRAGAADSMDWGSLISSHELSTWLRELDVAESILIVDACHSAASVSAAGFRPGPFADSGLGQLAFDKQMRVLAASQAEGVALEVNALRHGLLTYALIQEGLLDGRADTDPEDRILSFAEWLDYPANRLPSLAIELRSGKLNPTASARGVTVPQGVADAARRESGVQQPVLFDFSRSGRSKVLSGLPLQ